MRLEQLSTTASYWNRSLSVPCCKSCGRLHHEPLHDLIWNLLFQSYFARIIPLFSGLGRPTPQCRSQNRAIPCRSGFDRVVGSLPCRFLGHSFLFFSPQRFDLALRSSLVCRKGPPSRSECAPAPACLCADSVQLRHLMERAKGAIAGLALTAGSAARPPLRSATASSLQH